MYYRMSVMPWVFRVEIILILILLVFYWQRVVRHKITFTAEFFAAGILQIIGASIILLIEVYGLINVEVMLVLANTILVVSYFLLYDYHDSNRLMHPEGFLKLVYLFILTISIGFLLGTLLETGATMGLLQNRAYLALINSIGTIAFIRIAFYTLNESGVVSEIFGVFDKRLNTSRLYNLLTLLILLSLLFFILPTFIDINPEVRYILNLGIYGFVLILYTFTPFKILAYPLGVIWIGLVSTDSNLLYSRMISRNEKQRRVLLTINEKFETSFNPLNTLLQEALETNVDIVEVKGSDYSMYTKEVEGGKLILIAESNTTNLRHYSYFSLVNKITSTSSPVISIDRVLEDPEQVSIFLDTLLLPMEVSF